MSVTRIYVVSAEVNEWLVEAVSAGQAIRHITKNLYAARVASQGDLWRLMKAGKDVEKANDTTPKEQG
jgi:hypothetical protein